MTTHDSLFRSLADPTRRGLFEALCRDGEQTVGVLTRGAGVSQPVVTRHLAVLNRAGLIALRRAGRQTHVRARPEGLAPLTDWTGEMHSFWAAHLDALTVLLSRMDR